MPPRLTLLRVSTSHQKVVLEVDFSGSLWVRRLTFAPLNEHHSPQQRPLLTSRDTPKLPLYQTMQTCAPFIFILDSAVCSSSCTFRLFLRLTPGIFKRSTQSQLHLTKPNLSIMIRSHTSIFLHHRIAIHTQNSSESFIPHSQREMKESYPLLSRKRFP